MASNSTGKWVTRAASTGGGKTYRGQMPVNWYASLAVIVVVGVLLIGYSRYELVHPHVSSAGAPTTSDTWHAALAFDICGTTEPNLATSPSSATGFTTDGTGVVTIAPKNSSQTGGNATLGAFVKEYPGLQLTENLVRYPGKAVMTNGEDCPKGTPSAGKPGYVQVETWKNYADKTGTRVSGNPSSLLFTDGQLITVAFLPAGSNVPQPPAATVNSLVNAQSSGTTTSTTAAPTSTTTAPVTTTTAAGSGTTGTTK
jgi:hypothetical protein